MVEHINADLETHFHDFPQIVIRMVRARRADINRRQVEFERDAAELGVVIRRRDDAPRLVNVEQRTHVQVIRQRPSAMPHATDPQLSRASIEAIIDLIDMAGKGFQVARKEFLSLREEGLRHVLAGYLNAVFESTSVTGETFSKDGKPDLHIVVDGRPVLVVECKFWGGRALYERTLMEQLPRYVLWQHAVAVVITYSTKKSMSRVIADAMAATSESRLTRGPVIPKSETYFVSSQVHPDDEEKDLEVHHLFFNLHTSSDSLEGG